MYSPLYSIVLQPGITVVRKYWSSSRKEQRKYCGLSQLAWQFHGVVCRGWVFEVWWPRIRKLTDVMYRRPQFRIRRKHRNSPITLNGSEAIGSSNTYKWYHKSTQQWKKHPTKYNCCHSLFSQAPISWQVLSEMRSSWDCRKNHLIEEVYASQCG